jgi:hypothetical protein
VLNGRAQKRFIWRHGIRGVPVLATPLLFGILVLSGMMRLRNPREATGTFLTNYGNCGPGSRKEDPVNLRKCQSVLTPAEKVLDLTALGYKYDTE